MIANNESLSMSQQDYVFYDCIMRVIWGQLFIAISPMSQVKTENWTVFIQKLLFDDL